MFFKIAIIDWMCRNMCEYFISFSGVLFKDGLHGSLDCLKHVCFDYHVYGNRISGVVTVITCLNTIHHEANRRVTVAMASIWREDVCNNHVDKAKIACYSECSGAIFHKHYNLWCWYIIAICVTTCLPWRSGASRDAVQNVNIIYSKSTI